MSDVYAENHQKDPPPDEREDRQFWDRMAERMFPDLFAKANDGSPGRSHRMNRLRRYARVQVRLEELRKAGHTCGDCRRFWLAGRCDRNDRAVAVHEICTHHDFMGT